MTSERLPRPAESVLKTLKTLGKAPLEAPSDYFDQLGETFELRVLGTSVVFTRDPQWFDEVLLKKSKSFDKDRTTKGLSALIGQGLLVLDGATWRERRRVLSPPFIPSELEAQLGLFSTEARRAIADWRPGQVVDLHAAMAKMTMRVALLALFGYDTEDSEHFETHMAAAMRYFEGIAGTQIPLPSWIPTKTNRSFLRACAELRELCERLIDVPAPKGSVLSALQAARAEGRITRNEVLDEVMTMLVAGHETSALSLTYLFAELGLNPALQQPIAAEALDYSDPPSPSDIMRRGEVHRAVLEGLRLYPVAWAVGREAREDIKVQGYDVRRGAQVYLFSWSAQRSLRYFERPLEFWPGRWQTRPLGELPSGLFSAFGLGPRICIGRQFALSQIAVTLAEVLRTFRIETVSPFPPRLRASITARPHDPVLIRVLAP